MKRSSPDLYFSYLIDGIAENIHRAPKHVQNNCPDSEVPFPEIKSILVSASDYVGTVRLLQLEKVNNDILINYIINAASLIENICIVWIKFEQRAINSKRSNMNVTRRNVLLTKDLKKANRIISNLVPSLYQQLLKKVEREMELEEIQRLKRIEMKSKKFKIHVKA